MKQWIRGCLLTLIFVRSATSFGQEPLSLPTERATRDAVAKAAEWLTRHVRTGTLTVDGRERAISVIAWKDPTLAPKIESRLAGYTITDTLWASYALSLTHPSVAKQLHDSLEKMNCLTNSLHEVIWQRLESIHHKPVDPNVVHGRSLGIMTVGNATVDVRTFTMAGDANFTAGHPVLFAENAVYQSLFEFRAGKTDLAKARIRKILRPETGEGEFQILWDSETGLLIDFNSKSEYDDFLAGKKKSCRQYSFKVATLLYACRLMGLSQEFPADLDLMHRRLMAAQLDSGGLPHFYDVEAEGGAVKSRSEATGEATAIFILAETVNAKYPPQLDLEVKK